MCISMDKFSGALEKFSFFLRILGSKNAEENKGLGCSFIELKCRWLQTGLANLKKKDTIHLKFYL